MLNLRRIFSTRRGRRRPQHDHVRCPACNAVLAVPRATTFCCPCGTVFRIATQLDNIPVYQVRAPQNVNPWRRPELLALLPLVSFEGPKKEPLAATRESNHHESASGCCASGNDDNSFAPKFGGDNDNSDGISANDGWQEHDSMCLICLEEYTCGDKLRVLPCFHKFCAKCIDKWFMGGGEKCPLCATDVADALGRASLYSDTNALEQPMEELATPAVASAAT